MTFVRKECECRHADSSHNSNQRGCRFCSCTHFRDKGATDPAIGKSVELWQVTGSATECLSCVELRAKIAQREAERDAFAQSSLDAAKGLARMEQRTIAAEAQLAAVLRERDEAQAKLAEK